MGLGLDVPGSSRKSIGALRRRGARAIAFRHELRAPVAVDVRADPGHVQELVIRAVGNHPAKLRIESLDDRFRVGTRA
jgi:hypothetical protein